MHFDLVHEMQQPLYAFPRLPLYALPRLLLISFNSKANNTHFQIVNGTYRELIKLQRLHLRTVNSWSLAVTAAITKAPVRQPPAAAARRTRPSVGSSGNFERLLPRGFDKSPFSSNAPSACSCSNALETPKKNENCPGNPTSWK